MKPNSFKELQKQQEQEFNSTKMKTIKNNVDSTMGLARFVGSIAEIFVPLFGGVFVKMFGPEKNSHTDPNGNKNSYYPNK